MELTTKRIYDPASAEDGLRVLVDRLWPRGVAKADARVDEWPRELSVSDALRRWYDHQPDRWPEFRRRYFAELARNEAAVEALLGRIANGRATLLFASRESRLNNATALQEYLEARAGPAA